MDRRDLDIASLARRQHGVWSRKQALDIGLSPTMVRTRVRSGVWIRLDEGVYAHAAAMPTWERSVASALLAERWAAASHRTAAVLHELPGFRPGRPEVTVTAGAHARGHLAVVHRGIDVPTTKVRGLLVTTLPQTFIDLSQVTGEQRLSIALSAAADRDPGLLDAVRDRYCELAPRGGRNLRTLRATLLRFGAADRPTESELERVMRRVLTVPSIPEVVWQAPFPGRNPGRRRVDGLIPAWRVVVEGDGRAWHTRLEDFERDRRRDSEAAAAGLLTLRFTWHQLTTEPTWVRSVIEGAGAHRAA